MGTHTIDVPGSRLEDSKLFCQAWACCLCSDLQADLTADQSDVVYYFDVGPLGYQRGALYQSSKTSAGPHPDDPGQMPLVAQSPYQQWVPIHL